MTTMKVKEEKQEKNLSKGKKIKEIFVKTGHFSLDLLFPQDLKCIFCGNDIPSFSDKPYCDECEKAGVLNNGHRCRICDMPIYDESDVCEYCKINNETKKSKNKFNKAFCPFLYNDITKSAVVRFKDDNAKYLTKTFSKYICKLIKEANVTIDLIVPVPSHPKTIKRRGYNQAELLARQISKDLGNIEVNTTAIIKTSYSKQQKKLNYAQRQENISKSIKVVDLTPFKDKNVLIVDDVLTTCATVNTIASRIRHKAHNIYVATIARRDLKDSKPAKTKLIKEFFKKLFKKKEKSSRNF